MNWQLIWSEHHGQIITSIVVLVLTVLVARIVKSATRKYEKRGNSSLHASFLAKLLYALVWVIGITTIGSQFSGFATALNTILTSSGILALGVSLAAQESLTNLIDALFISAYKPFDLGDRIILPEKNNLTGVVTEMNLRHTIIKTYNNSSYIISNSALSNTIIENTTKNDSYTYPLIVSITYDSDIDKAMALLEDIVSSHPLVVDQRSPEQIANKEKQVKAVVHNFGASSMDLRVPVVTRNVGDNFSACADIRYQIKKRFDAEGIGFPFTTITIDNLSTLKDKK